MKIKYAILATLLLSLFVIVANTLAHRLVFHHSYENPSVNDWTVCNDEFASFHADSLVIYFSDLATFDYWITIATYDGEGNYLTTDSVFTTGRATAVYFEEFGQGYYGIDFASLSMRLPLSIVPTRRYVITERYDFYNSRIGVLSYEIVIDCDLGTGLSTDVQFNIIDAPFWYW